MFCLLVAVLVAETVEAMDGALVVVALVVFYWLNNYLWQRAPLLSRLALAELLIQMAVRLGLLALAVPLLAVVAVALMLLTLLGLKEEMGVLVVVAVSNLAELGLAFRGKEITVEMVQWVPVPAVAVVLVQWVRLLWAVSVPMAVMVFLLTPLLVLPFL